MDKELTLVKKALTISVQGCYTIVRRLKIIRMNRFLILGFEYNETIDYCLVRYKAKPEGNEYAITVMNGELEKLLFGSHIIPEKEGCLQVEITENRPQNKLKEQIAKALGELLNLPVQRVEAVN